MKSCLDVLVQSPSVVVRGVTSIYPRQPTDLPLLHNMTQAEGGSRRSKVTCNTSQEESDEVLRLPLGCM